jgi:ankyrin repeat protein
MKIKFTLILALLSLPLSLFATDTREHLSAIGGDYEFYGYFNLSRFYAAFEKAGIPKNDIVHYFGSNFVTAEEEFKTKYNISSDDIEDLAFAGSYSQDADGKRTSKVVILFKPKHDILKEIDESKEKIAGVPAITGISEKDDLCVIKHEGLIILANRKTIENYLTSYKNNNGKNSKAAEFASLSKDKLWYLRWNLSEESRKTFKESFEKDKRAYAFIKKNPYMQALYNIDVFEGGMNPDFSNIFLGIGSARAEDAERLVMFSHFGIVAASFAVSYILDDKTGTESVGKNDVDKIQDMLLRIHTTPQKKGVLLTFTMDDNDRKIIIEKSKERIAKSKKEAAERKMESIFNASLAYCDKGDVQSLQKSLNSGLDINFKDKGGKTLLASACKENQTTVVKFLLEHNADPNIPWLSGEYPIHIAIENSNSVILDLLLKAKADHTKLNYYGKAPLHIAAVKSVQICTLLIKNGADVNILTSTGETPLHLSAEHGTLDIVKYLLSAGADKTIQNDYGSIPADIARDSGFPDIEKLLRGK